VGLLALLRNEGGSVGTSLGHTILERRHQFHSLRLNEGLDPMNPELGRFLKDGAAFFLRHTGDAARSDQLALATFDRLRQQQALSLAYFDVFWSSAAVAAALVLLVLLMRRSVAEKGAAIVAE
jgi:DHA2 family multidrug resistance protein